MQTTYGLRTMDRGDHTAVGEPGVVYECQGCAVFTLQWTECPACGSTALEPALR